jgi:hypothetical protein
MTNTVSHGVRTWILLTVPLVAIVALAIVAGGWGGGLHDPDPPVGSPMLPDLSPMPPRDIQMKLVAGRWHLAFTSILVNVAPGDFLLRAKRDGGTWKVDQIVSYSKGGAAVVPTSASVVWGGDGHNHWHIRNVSTDRLVRMTDNGRPEPSSGRADTKIGFCFFDYRKQLDRGSTEAAYSRYSCGRDNSSIVGMGLSPGWGDTYSFILPGQTIDTTNLPDGTYRLWADVNAGRWFKEVTRRNNRTWVDVKLSTNKDGVRFALVTDHGPKPTWSEER